MFKVILKVFFKDNDYSGQNCIWKYTVRLMSNADVQTILAFLFRALVECMFLWRCMHVGLGSIETHSSQGTIISLVVVIRTSSLVF